MSFRELDALQAQFAELESLLGELEPADWERPTRCPGMSVRELVAHVVNVLPFWKTFLDATPEGAVTSDRVQWWRYDVAVESPKILARAQKGAEGRTPDDLVAGLEQNSQELVDAYRAAPPERLVGRARVALPAADLAAVGVVEVGVHSMDLGHAVNKGERIHSAAVPIVVEVLEGLAGEAIPAGLGWSPRTFILCATGRRALSPTERLVLGPAVAAKFPLLA